MTNLCYFVGIESYDLELYAARVLQVLGKTVLLSDNSDAKALSSCIPKPQGFEEGFTEYYGIYCAQNSEGNGAFEYVFLDCGFQIPQFVEGSRVFLVIDFQLHNIQWAANLRVPNGCAITIVLRNGGVSKVPVSSILEQMPFECEVVVIDDNQDDLEGKLACQYNDRIVFKKASTGMRNAIEVVVGDSVEYANFKKAMKIAARGR